MLERCHASDLLNPEDIFLRRDTAPTHGFDQVIGESDSLMHCLQQVASVAATQANVLLLGETGTGKELIARAIHERSQRSNMPLVTVNCASMPASLIDNELFGHDKGAFTGACSRKPGRFELANGGTLFLDEIGDFPIELQGKLLRVLQEGEFQLLGGAETLAVDVRLITATNQNLLNAVHHGVFRSDLYYRINTFPVELPPLRSRFGDILLLTEHFIRKHSASFGRDVRAISASMMQQLTTYSWPGNIRELEGVIQRALIFADGTVLDLAEPLDPGPQIGNDRFPASNIVSTNLNDFAKEHIQKVLSMSGWVVAGRTGAAAKLGIPPSTLRSKMKRLGINRPGQHA